MERTGFQDCKGREIYVGQAISVWDQEGGSGIGIVVEDKEYGFLIIDPSKDYRDEGGRHYRLWCFCALSGFAPNGVQLLKVDEG
jgi:hypothetical protein